MERRELHGSRITLEPARFIIAAPPRRSAGRLRASSSRRDSPFLTHFRRGGPSAKPWTRGLTCGRDRRRIASAARRIHRGSSRPELMRTSRGLASDRTIIHATTGIRTMSEEIHGPALLFRNSPFTGLLIIRRGVGGIN